MRKYGFSRPVWKAAGAMLVFGSLGFLVSATASAQDFQTPEPPTIDNVSDATSATSIYDADAAESRMASEYNTLIERINSGGGAPCADGACAGGACGCNGACDGGCADCDCGCNDCGWCNLGDPWTLSSVFEDDCGNSWLGRTDLGGWIQMGYHSENNGLFNSHPNNFNLHQAWIYAERLADGSQGWDWGYRVDFLYGVDGPDTQSFGNRPRAFDNNPSWDRGGSYGFAMPQLYGEIARGDLSVKLGHFYTISGVEVVPATGNFFYSHAYTMYNTEPFTHTGALAEYQASDALTLYGGWTAGWDTGFDRVDDGSIFLGGATLAVNDDTDVTYMTTIGDFGQRGGAFSEGYHHCLILDTQLTEKLNWILQSDLTETNGGADHQYGLNQYLIYTINDCLGVGTRVEWWKNAGNSQYEATFGVNVRPHANFVIRPEVRHDWNPGTDREFTTFGVDAIFTF